MSCINAMLDLTEIHHIKSISIPCLSAGRKGGCIRLCAYLIVKTVTDFITNRQMNNLPLSLKLVKFVDLDVSCVSAFESELRLLVDGDE